MSECHSYFVSAGEYSGDLLGAELVRGLRAVDSKSKFFGIVGPAMASEGVARSGDISELGMMGVVEVAKELGHLRRFEQRILAVIDREKPKAAILIDFPGFHFRLAEQLKMRGIPVFQFVAPKLWAWGKGRLPRLKRDFKHVLGILPFEEAFFRENGVSYSYVGTPLKNRVAQIVVDKRALGFDELAPLLAILPGSRWSEIKRIMPVLLSLQTRMSRQDPKLRFVVPIAPSLDFDRVVAFALSFLNVGEHDGAGHVSELAVSVGPVTFLRGMSLEVMRIADAAVVASGTATLECGLMGLPMAVAYVMDSLSYAIAAKAVKLPHISLVNLIAKRGIVQEYIQDIDLGKLQGELTALYRDTPRRQQMLADLAAMSHGLEGYSSQKMAHIILDGMA